jgi:hypothetical protein
MVEYTTTPTAEEPPVEDEATRLAREEQERQERENQWFRKAAAGLLALIEELQLLPLPDHAPDERTQWTHDHKNRKQRGGRPPQDYRLAEHKVDLERALAADDLTAARGPYYTLKRMLNC